MQEWVLARRDIPKNLRTPDCIIKEQYIETISPHQEHVLNTIVRDNKDFPYERDIFNDATKCATESVDRYDDLTTLSHNIESICVNKEILSNKDIDYSTEKSFDSCPEVVDEMKKSNETQLSALKCLLCNKLFQTQKKLSDQKRNVHCAMKYSLI